MKLLFGILFAISMTASCVASSETSTVSMHILGTVNNPGQYMIPKSENFQKAIQSHPGGFGRMAHIRNIGVSRTTMKDGKESRMVFTYDFEKPDDRTVGMILLDGDIIFVPQTIK